MSTTDQPVFYLYTGDDSTTVFTYNCYVLESTDMTVYFDDVLQSTALYTVNGVGDPNGGDVTFVNPPAQDVIIKLYRNLVLDRPTDYQPSGPFLEEVVDVDQDRQTQQIQQINEIAGRALTIAQGVSASGGLPTPEPLYYLQWNAAGDGLQNSAGSVTATITEPQVAEYGNTGNFFENTGTVDALVFTLPADTAYRAEYPPLSPYVDGMTVEFIGTGSNTGAMTARVSTGAIKDVTDEDGVALPAATFVVGVRYKIFYVLADDDFHYKVPAAASVPNKSITNAKIADGTLDTFLHFNAVTGEAEYTAATVGAGSIGLVELAVGDPDTYLGFDGGGNPAFITPPVALFTDTYEDGVGTTYTGVGQLVTWAHGLGSYLFGVFLYAECTVTDGGYSVGRRIMFSTSKKDSVTCDATNIYIKADSTSGLQATNTSGADFLLAASKWKLYAKAFV